MQQQRVNEPSGVVWSASSERSSVQPETLTLLDREPGGAGPENLRRLPMRDEDALVRHYVRGYWLVRYLDEKQPDALKGLLARRLAPQAMEEAITSQCGNHKGNLLPTR